MVNIFIGMRISRNIIHTNILKHTIVSLHINMAHLNSIIWKSLINDSKEFDAKQPYICSTLFAYCVCNVYGSMFYDILAKAKVSLYGIKCNALNNNLIITYRCGCSITDNILKTLSLVLSTDIGNIRDSYRKLCDKYGLTFSDAEFLYLRQRMYKDISIFVFVNDERYVDKNTKESTIHIVQDEVILSDFVETNKLNQPQDEISSVDRVTHPKPSLNVKGMEGYLVQDFFDHIKLKSRLVDNTVIIDDPSFKNDSNIEPHINTYLMLNYSSNLLYSILRDGLQKCLLDSSNAIDIINRIKNNETEDIRDIYTLINNALNRITK